MNNPCQYAILDSSRSCIAIATHSDTISALSFRFVNMTNPTLLSKWSKVSFCDRNSCLHRLVALLLLGSQITTSSIGHLFRVVYLLRIAVGVVCWLQLGRSFRLWFNHGELLEPETESVLQALVTIAELRREQLIRKGLVVIVDNLVITVLELNTKQNYFFAVEKLKQSSHLKYCGRLIRSLDITATVALSHHAHHVKGSGGHQNGWYVAAADDHFLLHIALR